MLPTSTSGALVSYELIITRLTPSAMPCCINQAFLVYFRSFQTILQKKLYTLAGLELGSLKLKAITLTT